MKVSIKLDVPVKTRIARLKIRIVEKRRSFNKKIPNYARDDFYDHLIKQEVRMWFNYPNRFSKEDWKYIVTRRGFNIFEQHTILTLLYSLGLPTQNIELIDLEQYKKEMMEQALVESIVNCLHQWVPLEMYKDKKVYGTSIGKIFGIMFGKFDWRK